MKFQGSEPLKYRLVSPIFTYLQSFTVFTLVQSVRKCRIQRIAVTSIKSISFSQLLALEQRVSVKATGANLTALIRLTASGEFSNRQQATTHRAANSEERRVWKKISKRTQRDDLDRHFGVNKEQNHCHQNVFWYQNIPKMLWRVLGLRASASNPTW